MLQIAFKKSTCVLSAIPSGSSAFGADLPGSTNFRLPVAGGNSDGLCGRPIAARLEIQHENGLAQYWSPARTTTTLLALFVGIFTIGLILVLGQDLHDTINNTLASDLTYNVITVASKNEVGALQARQNTIPCLSKSSQNTISTTVPVSINNQPIADILKNLPSNSFANVGRQNVLSELSGVQGFDVANNQFPSEWVGKRSCPHG